MPNYVNNRVIIRHEDTKKLAMLDEAYCNRTLFQTILPVPEGLLGTPNGRYADPEKQAAMEQRQAENRKQYGYSTDYSWRVENWGVKWEAIGNDESLFKEGDAELVLEFQTPWGPPTGIYKALREAGYQTEWDWWEEYEEYDN